MMFFKNKNKKYVIYSTKRNKYINKIALLKENIITDEIENITCTVDDIAKGNKFIYTKNFRMFLGEIPTGFDNRCLRNEINKLRDFTIDVLIIVSNKGLKTDDCILTKRKI